MTNTAPPLSVPRIAIPCAHAGCRNLAAAVSMQGSTVLVEIISKHHGATHRTVLTISNISGTVELTTEPA